MKICKINWRHPAKLLLPAAFATALMAPMADAAVIIDFNDLTGGGQVLRGSTYTEDGFVLNGIGLTSIHSLDPLFTGTVSFYSPSDGIIRLTRSGGGAFDLASIDLDTMMGGNARVDFMGLLTDNSVVPQSFVTDATFPGLQTFSFGAAFDNVVAVIWSQSNPDHSFDNIVVNPVIASSDVPEPMTLSLLGAGLAGVAWARRRQAAKA